MNIKKILTAAAAATVLSTAAVATAAAAPIIIVHGMHDHFRHDDWRGRRVVEHRVVFETLRFHKIRYAGNPYFVHGHYVVKSFDRFGRVTFVEVNPYTGALVGFIRL